jgi:hypothetical protein
VSSGGVYDAIGSLAIKGNKSGAAVSCDVSPIEHTMKVKAASKNLFPNFIKTSTYANGSTVTVNEDGSITVHKVAGDTISAMTTFNLKEDGIYTLSNGLGTGSNVYFQINPSSSLVTAAAGSRTDTLKSGELRVTFYAASAIVEDVTLYPQLEKGSTATPYTPYIEDVTAANVIMCGKNLFNETAYPLTSGYIRYDTGDVATHANYICTQDYVPCAHLQGMTITFDKCTATGSYTGLAWYDKNKAYISGVHSNAGKGYTAIIVPNNAEYMRFTEDAGATEFQIEIGTTTTDYEPFKATTIYPISADGTVSGITSIHPITMLMSDTKGVMLDVEYNRDINSAFAELQSIVNTLIGG